MSTHCSYKMSSDTDITRNLLHCMAINTEKIHHKKYEVCGKGICQTFTNCIRQSIFE